MNARKPRLKRPKVKGFKVEEEVKIAVDIVLNQFRFDDAKEYTFPSSMSSNERAYVHKLCHNLGIISKSKGKECNRVLTIYKRDISKKALSEKMLVLLEPRVFNETRAFVNRYPVTSKERAELQAHAESSASPVRDSGALRGSMMKTSGRVNGGVPQVPPARKPSEFDSFCQSLPIGEYKQKILDIVAKNRVVLVIGETGCGKTTQIPQFLLDASHVAGKPCRLLCAQPRRLTTVAIAERVAAERGEHVGETVGYQIRLESRVSPKTLLTFCTNGVLLRTLMGGDEALQSVTHIIVDEVHERDRFCDFLLIQLREELHRHPHIRVLLMSASLDARLFQTYFHGCPIVELPGRLYDVKVMYLEDVLRSTGYSTRQMKKIHLEQQNSSRQENLTESTQNKNKSSVHEFQPSGALPAQPSENIDSLVGNFASGTDTQQSESSILESSLQMEVDACITELWIEENAWNQLFYLLQSEGVDVDCRHSEKGITPLMVASARGLPSQVKQLLSFGADPHLKNPMAWNAFDWATKYEQSNVMKLLEAHIQSFFFWSRDNVDEYVEGSGCGEELKLLQAYHHSFDDEQVDINLILHILDCICKSSTEGAVLVFLPGYSEIVLLRDRLLYDDQRFCEQKHRLQLFTLHSNLQTSDQKRVLKPAYPGTRKIILSTNIAETSITVNDVVFVIDSGRVKEKSYDAISSVTMLKSVWISKASAIQRRGRAGRCRPGVCFHLFSCRRFMNMEEYQTPELLREPLQELSLYTKLLAPKNVTVEEFLTKAPEPPSLLLIKNALTLLKAMDAMDEFQDLTVLGHHLSELPIEPRFGKMVLYSVVLKCLDPVLTIACSLAHREPFLLPSQSSQRHTAWACRRNFAANTCSDHMVLLRAFQAWQKAYAEGWERAFCERNYLSQGTMEMIIGMRAQLLGQLRASGFVRGRGGGDIRELNVNSDNWAVVKAALVAGLYPNVAHVNRANRTLNSSWKPCLRFHQASVLLLPQTSKVTTQKNQEAVAALPTDWIVFDEMSHQHCQACVRCCSAISPVTIALFAGPAWLPKNAMSGLQSVPCNVVLDESSDSGEDETIPQDEAILHLTDWLQLQMESEEASLLLQLRMKWNVLFLRHMRSPAKPLSAADEATMRAVVNALTNQEEAMGLTQPIGIGQRPRPTVCEDLPAQGRSARARKTQVEVPDKASTERFSGSKQKLADRTDWWRKGDDRRFASLSASMPDQGGKSTSPVNTTSTFINKVSARYPQSAAVPPTFKYKLAYTNTAPPPDNCKRPLNQKLPLAAPEMDSFAAKTTTTMTTNSWQSSTMCIAPDVVLPSSSSSIHQPPPGLAHMPGTPCYFLMKCSNHKYLEVSRLKGIWSTSASNEQKLSKAFRQASCIYLIFTVHGSGNFQGYAMMLSDITTEQNVQLKELGRSGIFRVQWQRYGNVPLPHIRYRADPWSEEKTLQTCPDGWEFESHVGQQILRLWSSPAQAEIQEMIPALNTKLENIGLNDNPGSL
uniref:3'-5' RNA helicase YTHDC2-like n=1 Tax=Myxine glutinosa TaxID=7769 RepID=UPI00358E29D8